MCLKLEKDAVKLIAEEDIVCHKFLHMASIKISNLEIIDAEIKTGDTFTGIVKDKEVEGVINRVKNKIYLLTNNDDLNGCGSHALGYLYSWALDFLVQKLIINNQEFNSKKFLATIYRDFPIEIGQTYTSDLTKIDDRIEKGLHSYAEYIKDCDYISVKCLIPKGSGYYIGEFGEQVSYASDTLKYVEII